MRILKTLAVFLILLSLVACYRSPCVELAASAPDGEKLEQSFSSVEGGFKIGLPPAKPFQPKPGEKDIGTRFKWMVLNQGQYDIHYFDAEQNLENEAAETFDRFRDLLLSKGPGNLEVDKDLLLSGHPGREIRIKDASGINIQRFYIVGQRVYTVTAFVPIKLDCALESVTKVLDSFQLINEKSVASTNSIHHLEHSHSDRNPFRLI